MMDFEKEGVYISLSQLLKFGYMPKNFTIRPHSAVLSKLSGRHMSGMRGRGMDFSEMKQYVQGDDTRNIDWKATRRTGKPYMRVYNEERDRNVWLVVSQMNSMFFGSKNSMKSVTAAKSAGVLAFKALEMGDRLGGVIYNNDELKFFKASSGKKSLVQMMREIERQNHLLHASNQNNQKGNLSKSLKILSSFVKHDDLVILIGDGRALDEDTQRHITRINMHNDVLGILIYDPMEQEIVKANSLFFTDGQSSVDINTSDKKFIEDYAKRLSMRKEAFRQLSHKNALPVISISTHISVLQQLHEQLNLPRGKQ